MAGQRLFAAVALPPEVAAAVAAEERRLAGRLRGGRWIAAENLHITVCFFGDVGEGAVSGLTRELSDVVGGLPAPEFRFDGFAAAPPGSRRLTMIWAVFDGGAAFAGLAAGIRGAAGPFAPEMPPEKEPVAHVTLARFRDGLVREPEFGPFEPVRFSAASCDLMESRLTPSGPEYSVLARMNFRRS